MTLTVSTRVVVPLYAVAAAVGWLVAFGIELELVGTPKQPSPTVS